MGCNKIKGHAVELLIDFDGDGSYVPILATTTKSLDLSPTKVDTTTTGSGEFPESCQIHLPISVSLTLLAEQGDATIHKLIQKIQLRVPIKVKMKHFGDNLEMEGTFTIDGLSPDAPNDGVVTASITLGSTGAWTVAPIV